MESWNARIITALSYYLLGPSFSFMDSALLMAYMGYMTSSLDRLISKGEPDISDVEAF